MPRALITVFEPFGRWGENSSQLCLDELQRTLPAGFDVTTAVYPVDFEQAHQRLRDDLRREYDVALHLGQAAESVDVRLEAVARNIRQTPDEAESLLLEGGPDVYESPWPLADWCCALSDQGAPASVSRDAGTYLCNATLYWSRHYSLLSGLPTRQAFLHLPLAPRQAQGVDRDATTLCPKTTAQAALWVLEALARQPPLAGGR